MIKEVTEMKKILLLTTMVLAVSFGTAYAYHGSGVGATGKSANQPKNGITVFCTPATFDSLPMAIGSKRASSYEEGSAAGGLRSEETAMEPYNGVTIFSFAPLTFDNLAPAAGAVSGTYFEESAAAGGLRTGEWGPELNNGITDFTGRTYDSINAGTEGAGM
jgi:hypothetical protein